MLTSNKERTKIKTWSRYVLDAKEGHVKPGNRINEWTLSHEGPLDNYMQKTYNNLLQETDSEKDL